MDEVTEKLYELLLSLKIPSEQAEIMARKAPAGVREDAAKMSQTDLNLHAHDMGLYSLQAAARKEITDLAMEGKEESLRKCFSFLSKSNHIEELMDHLTTHTVLKKEPLALVLTAMSGYLLYLAGQSVGQKSSVFAGMLSIVMLYAEVPTSTLNQVAEVLNDEDNPARH
jgi:hypothetical protein